MWTCRFKALQKVVNAWIMWELYSFFTEMKKSLDTIIKLAFWSIWEHRKWVSAKKKRHYFHFLNCVCKLLSVHRNARYKIMHIQLTLEQQRFEQHRSAYLQILFNKYYSTKSSRMADSDFWVDMQGVVGAVYHHVIQWSTVVSEEENTS